MAVFSLQAALALIPSSLAITAHEGDLLHMLDAALRMADGERPHLDFMTPIGILGFAPVAGFLSLGFAVGKAAMLSNIAVAAALLPVTWWVGASRLTLAQAAFFGLAMLALLTALIYGGGETKTSFSMYYNRWAWGISFLILAVAVFPARVDLFERIIAPVVIGAGMAVLAMLKVTFFVPLVPALFLILLARKKLPALLGAIGVGLLIGVVLIGYLGWDFFLAYRDDLLMVAAPGSSRSFPGYGMSDIIASPATMLGSLSLLASLIIFRKSGLMLQGLIIFILAPAFMYITYQNWGNDPKWLFFMVLFLWVNLPKPGLAGAFGLPARQSILAILVVVSTLAFPSLQSMLISPFRAAFGPREGFVKLPLQDENLADIYLKRGKVLTARFDSPVPGLAPSLPLREPVVLNDYRFPDCQSDRSPVAMALAMVREMEANGEAIGKQVLTADILSASWLLGNVARVEGAAPWYYGGDSGLEHAEYLSVPLCPVRQTSRKQMTDRFLAADIALEEVFRSDLQVLFRVGRNGS